MNPKSDAHRSSSVGKRKVGVTKKRKRVLLQVPEHIAKVLSEPGAELRVKFQSLDPPVLIIDGQRIEGRFEDVVGTDLVFDQTKTENAGYIAGCTRRLLCKQD
ncbi:hypothetical protein BWQ96_06773 [Gracilariopsis chorda]|uniref:Transcription factor TFIIIC triple barrel domain-containing protein n=1 Tax=Gracilariopsis chorda TaxID=448386 RepID=A0A2V3IQQ2_9FLOR|nr:hypothetical protein BWQ96_06773 [Gracilariopsis chorda]|eukprot:PXF43480.1 hypothetical protein BWQ96_06773 [Gracilariopsis chorda]